MDKYIDFNSGDWKQRNEFMYYSHEKDSWYCTKCKLLIEWPRPAGIHAEEHNLTLPCSRKKPEVKIVKPIPQKISIQNIAEKEVESISSQPSNFQSYSTPVNVRRIYSHPPPRSGRADPEELKKWRRQQGEDKISFMRRLGCTEKEIDDAKVEFGLKTREQLLAEREEFRRKKQLDDLYLMKVASVPDPEQQVNLLMEYYILRQM